MNKNKSKKIKFISFLVVCFFLSFSLAFVLPSQSNAQTSSDVIITWEALNFYPSDYKAKTTATKQSEILVSATYTRGGNFVNSSNVQYRWFVDGNLYKKGVGLKEIKIDMSNFDQNQQFIRVEAIQNGQTTEESVTINLDGPQIVLRSSTGNRRTLKPGEKVNLTAVPYFFDVNSFENLSFYWKINGKKQNNTTNTLTLDLSESNRLSGKRILVSSIVSNTKTKMEVVEEQLLFEVQ